VIAGNDFSYAAAHGVEVTFGFDNHVVSNRLTGNAICGIWGGYSQDTLIAGNQIEGNGEMGYGAEHGGVNIEHGRGNRIVSNVFAGNRGGVFLWWDDDAELLATPWAAANVPDCAENVVAGNSFRGDDPAVKLRRCDGTELMLDGDPPVDLDEHSRERLRPVEDDQRADLAAEVSTRLGADAIGDARPVGARGDRTGREKIIMTEWGPYDWERPLLRRVASEARQHVWELLGDAAATAPAPIASLDAPGGGARADWTAERRVAVSTAIGGSVQPYVLTVRTTEGDVTARGVLEPLDWTVAFFAWTIDPREQYEAWLAESAGAATQRHSGALALPFRGGGPPGTDLAADRFGTIAETTVTLPDGRWRLVTTSDDGIRVRLGDDLVIDDWTWHAPKRITHDLDLPAPATFPLRVEHFELDGYAILELRFEPASPLR
jgi:hypothetical protein